MKINQWCIKTIKKYQNNKQTYGRCKHIPTCSNYGIKCYKKFNFFKASYLTAFRILKCNPLTKNYYDPVPLTNKEKKEQKESFNNYISLHKTFFDNLAKNKQNNYINLEILFEYTSYHYNKFSADFYNMFDCYIYLIKSKLIKLPYKKSKQEVYLYLLKIK